MNALALAALLLTGLDWSQTTYVARHPCCKHEDNPAMGLHPATGRVNTYFAVATVGTAVVAAALHPTARRWWLRAVVAVELANVVRNRFVGVGFSF